MKVDEIKQELASLTVPELTVRIEQYRRELLTLRLNALTSQVKDYSLFEKLRKNIARGMAYKHQKAKQAR